MVIFWSPRKTNVLVKKEDMFSERRTYGNPRAVLFDRVGTLVYTRTNLGYKAGLKYTSSITGMSSKTKLINFLLDVPLFHYYV